MKAQHRRTSLQSADSRLTATQAHSKSDWLKVTVRLSLPHAHLGARGRHVRSTMAPLSAPTSSRAIGEGDARNLLNKQCIPAVDAASGRVGRTAHCAARWGSARVPSKGGATPCFGAVLAPVPLGAAADQGVATPWLGTMHSAACRAAIGSRERRRIDHDRDTRSCLDLSESRATIAPRLWPRSDRDATSALIWP